MSEWNLDFQSDVKSIRFVLVQMCYCCLPYVQFLLTEFKVKHTNSSLHSDADTLCVCVRVCVIREQTLMPGTLNSRFSRPTISSLIAVR
jgi:hypothetical protein